MNFVKFVENILCIVYVNSTQNETTLSAFLQRFSDYEIDLDSKIKSMSGYKDGTTGYNITTSMGKFQILKRLKTYTDARFVLLHYNKAC